MTFTRVHSWLGSIGDGAVALVVAAAVSGLARVPVSAQACSQWNISGAWQVTQSNGYSPTLNLQQSGTTITGTLTYSPSDQAKATLSQPALV